MKIFLPLILIFALLTSAFAFFEVPASAAMPSPEVINGYKNVCLTYTYRPNRDDYARQTVEDLLPYVAYLDTNGEMKDFFFDAYLFLPCNTRGPSGATIHGGPNEPSKAIDWIDYVEDTFIDGYNVDALNTAFGRAKETLGDSERKAGVFFSILYPAQNAENFGSLGGKELDLSKQEDREYAIRWIIDEQIKLYEEGGYDNLDLVGFYWLEEEIYTKYDQDMLIYASEYLHSKGLKFIWIPWYQAPGYNNWKLYGFDLVCMQPNDMWPDVSDLARVKECAKLCKAYGLSMQIESSHDCASPDRYARYLRYLDGGMNAGGMNSVRFYYQEGKKAVYYSACYSKNKTFRSIYDLTYKYATGTLTKSDFAGDLEEKTFELPENVEWVSQGKSYTGCSGYTGAGNLPYQDVSGTELTDGILGSSKDGTEWHAYYNRFLDDEGRISTTIDLGETYDGLNRIVAQFLDNQDLGAGLPSDVKVYVSEDGENFSLINTMTLKKDGDKYYFEFNKSAGFSARYVKLSFMSVFNKYVFCSEFMVGRDVKESDEDADDSSKSPESESADESSDGASNSNESGDGSLEDESGSGSTNLWRFGVSALLIVALAIIFFMKKSKKNS